MARARRDLRFALEADERLRVFRNLVRTEHGHAAEFFDDAAMWNYAAEDGGGISHSERILRLFPDNCR